MWFHDSLLRKGEKMDLRRYLFENNMTQREFAKKIDYTSNYVNMIVKGRLKPFKPLAEAIEKATNGLVRYDYYKSKEQEDGDDA